MFFLLTVLESVHHITRKCTPLESVQCIRVETLYLCNHKYNLRHCLLYLGVGINVCFLYRHFSKVYTAPYTQKVYTT
jgi:hypothetical protein